MTRFTKFTTGLTAALALSLISAGAVSADPGRGFQGHRGYPGPQRDRVDVDIRSLQATYTPRGFASGVEVTYRVSAEDVRRGQSFNLQLSVIDCGRAIQTIVVPLTGGVACGRDEVEFRGCVMIPAGRGFGRGMERMTVEASVTHCGGGRVLECERTAIRVCGPTFRDHDRDHGYGRGHGRGGWGR